jgi:zinc protease
VIRRARIVLAFLVLAVAGIAPDAFAGVFNPKTFTLDNGMQVVLIENRRIPAVTHMVWYKAGAADEPWGQSGVAHYLEHLMFKGTRDTPPGEFSRLVAVNGGRENAFTTQDYTAYYQTVARDRLELVMRLEADRMANLVIDPESAKPELQVVLEERRSRVDNDPGAQLDEQMRAVLFLHHPYGIPVIGWEPEIKRLTAAEATQFYRTHYAPNNAILVVAGDITVDELKPLAEKYYGAIPRRALAPRLSVLEPNPIAPRRVALESEQVRRPSLSRTYLAPSHGASLRPEVYALEVLGELLGGGATSRLYRSLVVEQKLAVGAGAYYSANGIDWSRFAFSLSPQENVDLTKLEAGLDAEIAKLLKDGVTEEEVERAKGRLQSQAIYARDSLETGARAIGAALSLGRTIDDVETWPERIGAVTPQQVMAAAKLVLRPERAVTGTLSPAKR